MPSSARSLARVLASVAVLSLALVFVEATVANGAGTWSNQSEIDQGPPSFPASLTSVSCASDSFCAAVDNEGNALTYNGSSWTSPSNIDGNSTIDSVSCPSAGFCVAVDNAGNAFTYNGSSWSSPSNIDGSSTINSVSCPTARFCAAVDNVGNALTYNGSSWSSPSNIDGNTATTPSHLTSVSCPTVTFCAAGGDYYNDPTFYYSTLVYNGSTWSSPSNFVDQNHNDIIESVSCPSAAFCLAADDGGDTLTYNGFSWSSPALAITDYPAAVSCPSATFCAAVMGDGHAWNYNGSKWSMATGFEDYAFNSVSCPNAYFCVAVDDQGTFATYLSTPTPPTVTSVSPHTGPTSGGTSITITGTHFVAPATVNIGSGSGAILIRAGVVVVSPTEITFNTGGIGTKAGHFNVFVNSSGVTSAVSAGDLFTYVPTVTSVHPHIGATSGGTAITVTGTGFVTGARVVIAQGDGSGSGAIAATNVDVVSTTKITATTGGAAKAGSFNLFVTSSGITSAPDAGDLFTYG